MPSYSRVELKILQEVRDTQRAQEKTRPRIDCKNHGRTPICSYCKKCIRCREEDDGGQTIDTGWYYFCRWCFELHYDDIMDRDDL